REQTQDGTPVARVLDQPRGAAEIARVALRRARAVECGTRACGLDAAAERGDVVRIRRGRRAAEARVGGPGGRGEGERGEEEEGDGTHPGTQPHRLPCRQGKIGMRITMLVRLTAPLKPEIGPTHADLGTVAD